MSVPIRAGGATTPDKTVRLTPFGAILQYARGDKIADETQFVELSAAFFAELGRKFV